MSEKQVKRIFDKVGEVPPFSKFADRAMAAEKEKSGNHGMEHRFHDPTFAKQILQMTNFASFGFSGSRAGSFESDAFLAGDVLRGMMLAFSVEEYINRELPGYRLYEGQLWEHAMNCGLSAWMVATKVGYPDLEAAFVAGMMHDVGKVIMSEFLAEENDTFDDIISQGEMTPAEAERAIFGTDHAEVGALVAEHWDFAESVVEAIRYHHQPELAQKDPDLTALVHLADCISVSLGAVSSGSGLIGLLASDFSESDPTRQAG